MSETKDNGPFPFEIGPLPKDSSPFTRKMRRHQAWYRANVLKLPCGTGPFTTSTDLLASMLRGEDAEKGLNFLTPEIFGAVKARLAEAEGLIEEFRLLRNLLSSQPLCFNLFGYMGLHLDLARNWLDSVLPGTVKRVIRVIVEHNPEPKEEYLNDRTAFDSFMEYIDVDDNLAFVGIETKLTEPFSPKEYDLSEYRRWMGPDSPWKEEAESRVAEVKHNQLWRDHLLAVAMVGHADSPYAHGRLMLVRHPGDTKCAEVTRGYQNLLRQGDATFTDMPLNTVCDHLRNLTLTPEHQKWLAAFEKRYMDLHRSQE